jgi:serine/threonine protein kinase
LIYYNIYGAGLEITMNNNFICAYCLKNHPAEIAVCPETGDPITPVHKLSFTTLEDKYAINGLIGEGGMGVIYDADDLKTGGRVAIKFLNPSVCQSRESYERFKREAEAAAIIDHENIVKVLDIGTSSFGIPYIVMEFLVGEDLGLRMGSIVRFPMEGMVGILSKILETFTAVHARGIVHRDLKPENVFLAEDSRGGEVVKILDFGVARLSTYEKGAGRLSSSGHVFGTPYYISPEQAEGKANVDHRSDLYSAGVMLYEMITGHLPFAAGAFGRILVDIITRPVPDPRIYNPSVPQPTVDFLYPALAKDPNERFQLAQEMLRELHSLDLSLMVQVPCPAGRLKLDLYSSRAAKARNMQPGGTAEGKGGPPPSRGPRPAPRRRTPGTYRIIVPSPKGPEGTEEGTWRPDEKIAVKLPPPDAVKLPLPAGEQSPVPGPAAKKEKARTLPRSKSKVSDGASKNQLSTPTSDRDDENE